MASDDDDTVLGTEWESFTVPTEFAVPFTSHAEPTELYIDLLAERSDLVPFETDVEAFTESRALVDVFLPYRAADKNDLYEAWMHVFDACLNEGDNIFTKKLTDLDLEQLVEHGLRLAMTPPTLFGRCVSFCVADRKANFKLQRIESSVIPDTIQAERHDIIQWRVCYELLGKAFDLDMWQSSFVTPLTNDIPPTQPVIELVYGNEVITVDQDTRDCLDEAILGMSSRPPIFFNCKQVFTSVCKVLKKDLLQYTMPQTEEDIEVDWSTVDFANPKTFPKAPSPSKRDFGIFNLVYNYEKDRKDEKARAQGRPNAGVPSDITMKQRWKRWRDAHAPFRAMFPNESLQMITDRVTIALKASSSEPDMDKRIGEAIRTHQGKLKREARKREAEQQLLAKQQQEAEAKERAAQLATKKAKVQQERIALQSRNASEFADTRSTRAKKPKQSHLNQLKKQAVIKKTEELKETEKQLKAARDEASKIEDEKNKQKRKVEQVNEAIVKKKTRRNDVSRLDDATATPREKGDESASWKPPMLDNRKYQSPGQKWEEESVGKLALLSSLRAHLGSKHLIPQPTTFPMVMELLGFDYTNSTFNERIFVHMVFLILRLNSSFDDSVQIMAQFNAAGKTDSNSVASMTARAVQDLIDSECPENESGATIHKIATQLNALGGIVPTTPDGLADLGLDSVVVALLLQHVFGSSELVVGLHARKILTALDMVDWEETGVTNKSEVKMAKLPTDKVKKSLQTWLPKGEVAGFHDTMDALGNLLSSMSVGQWGRIKSAIGNHFAPKEKEKLLLMVETICQFYKATKSGGRSCI